MKGTPWPKSWIFYLRVGIFREEPMSKAHSGLKLAGGMILTQPYSYAPELYRFSIYSRGWANSSSEGRNTFISSTYEKSSSFYFNRLSWMAIWI